MGGMFEFDGAQAVISRLVALYLIYCRRPNNLDQARFEFHSSPHVTTLPIIIN